MALIGGIVHIAATSHAEPGGERRVALVVGNASYDFIPALESPTRDAEAVAQSLSSLGFTVFLTTDLDREAFEKAVTFFVSRAKQADTALFYYAGHGTSIDGRSYFLPTDFGNGGLLDVREAVSLERYLDRTADGLRQNIVIIDACRENPLLGKNAQTENLSGSEQTARTTLRSGTLVSYATTPGNVAFDGTGRHSPYTGALLDHLATPGVDIEVMLKSVRRDVVVNTNGAQIPWMESSLLSTLRLSDGATDRIPYASQTGARPGRPHGANLSESGFGQKPILSRMQVGLSLAQQDQAQGHAVSDRREEQHSDRVRRLLCTVIEGPLPAACRQ